MLSAAAYMAMFELNTLLFSDFSFATSVDWIYFPSGLRLAFVLIFGVWGALGVVVASIAGSLIHYFSGDMVTAVGAGLIEGLAPLLARSVSVQVLNFDSELRDLTVEMLFKVVAMFSVLSATIHQLWFTFRGYSDNFISNTAVMTFGDFAGTVLLLYAAKFLLHQFPIFGEDRKFSELE